MDHNFFKFLVLNLHAVPENRIADFRIFNHAAIPNRHVRTDLGILDDHVLADVARHDNFRTVKFRSHLFVAFKNMRIRFKQRLDKAAVQPLFNRSRAELAAALNHAFKSIRQLEFALRTDVVLHEVVQGLLKSLDILDIIKGKRTRDDVPEGVIVYSIAGRPIKARSENQQRLVDAYQNNDMVFAVGPAGTGKTYLSIALAVKALKEKTAKKIILSRPAVEAGEKLGFLPGDMKDKIDPYLQPLYDALEDMIPQVKLQDMMEKHVIQIAPLAFMRGRTLSDAVVILDEAQNTTPAQIRMFLTRMGWNTKMIITGDMTQIDLPHSQKSGLIEALHILNNVEGIGVVNLNGKDIVRHKLVTRIVNAYENFDKEYKNNNESINKD